MLPVGAIYAAIYFVLFRWVILRFHLPTPGREREGVASPSPGAAPTSRRAAYIPRSAMPPTCVRLMRARHDCR